MKQRPAGRAGWFWIGLLTFGVLACSGSESAGPGANEVRSIKELPNSQVLFEGTGPLRAAVYRTDSVFGGLVIGRLTLDGRRGDAVGLQLDIPDYVLEAVGPNAPVRIVANGRSESFGLRELTQGMTVYRLARTGQTHLTVELERRVEGVRDGAVTLVLRTSATIQSAQLPWQKAPSPELRKPASLAVTASCSIQIGSGSCGTVTYTVVPSTGTTLPPGYTQIGGTFQSQTGNGPSTTIRITFSAHIESITATIHDPTWTGNRMVAFDLNTGQQVSVDFVGNGTPGTTTTDTKTLTGRFASVDLIPAANDYVSYDAEVVVAPCPPSNDANLESEAVRDSLMDVLSRSNPNAAPGSRLERGGVIWERQDGTRFATEVGPPWATQSECGYSSSVAGMPLPEPNVVGVAYFHTHPHNTGEPVYQCQAPPGQPPYSQFPGDGKIVPTATPNANGGLSNADWTAANQGFPVYAITKAGMVYRGDPNTPVNQRASNPNKWKWNDPAHPGCFVP
jgi:hypothetical protein